MSDLDKVSADRDACVRLGGLVHAAVREVRHDDSALELFRAARDVAEARLPGPLGVAVAAVLALAADTRAQAGIGGSLGASQSTLALALAVLGTEPG